MKNNNFTFNKGLALFLLLTACSSSPKQGAEIAGRVDEQTYEELIKKNTRHDLQYEGFHNKFEIYATFINSEVQTAILQKTSDGQQWDTKQAQSEREKLFQESASQTKFTMSFYTPSVRINDLHKGSSSWKVYLVSGGERYEGKVSRRNGKLENISAIYPFHNRWSVAYDVVFNIPLSGVEAGPATLVVTSTQGTAKLQY